MNMKRDHFHFQVQIYRWSVVNKFCTKNVFVRFVLIKILHAIDATVLNVDGKSLSRSNKNQSNEKPSF